MKYVKLYASLLHGSELSCEYSLVIYPTSRTIITALLDKICPTLISKTIFTNLLDGIYKLNVQSLLHIFGDKILGNIYSSVVKVSYKD